MRNDPWEGIVDQLGIIPYGHKIEPERGGWLSLPPALSFFRSALLFFHPLRHDASNDPGARWQVFLQAAAVVEGTQQGAVHAAIMGNFSQFMIILSTLVEAVKNLEYFISR